MHPLLMNKKKLILTGFLIMLSGLSVMLYAPTIAAAADKIQFEKNINEQRLIGRWVRPDGGYVLELQTIKKNGTMRAAYFNPQPIKVFKAEWDRKKGGINIFVELRDVNYPGSKYNLRYDPSTDILKGTYFQAVHGETYEVEFVRAK